MKRESSAFYEGSEDYIDTGDFVRSGIFAPLFLKKWNEEVFKKKNKKHVKYPRFREDNNEKDYFVPRNDRIDPETSSG